MPRKTKNESEAFYKILPQRLRELMRENNGTHDELAAVLGVQRQTVTNYCNGVSAPTWENLVVIADYFGVSLDYLLGRTEAKSPDCPDIRAVCDYTGLSQKAVEYLHLESEDKALISALCRFFESDVDELQRLTWYMCKAIEFSIKADLLEDFDNPFSLFLPEESRGTIMDAINAWGGTMLSSRESVDYYVTEATNLFRELVKKLPTRGVHIPGKE